MWGDCGDEKLLENRKPGGYGSTYLEVPNRLSEFSDGGLGNNRYITGIRNIHGYMSPQIPSSSSSRPNSILRHILHSSERLRSSVPAAWQHKVEKTRGKRILIGGNKYTVPSNRYLGI